jgi:hypothetical protein
MAVRRTRKTTRKSAKRKVTKKKTAARKCAARTKAGKRCKRPAVKGSKYCSIHKRR